ncbi:PepSY domain-containing protein [Sphingobacterium daejeonense]|uniref:PepSY-associated TM helix domain-containing protein n=1 Tax=Sphingobacterium daejeonense TaxID=371142 RepID=UPI0021A5E2D1|nr:PepSY-associated TM helix domain-containing protein [Sphingobacterium daejeonense]MCT1529860.1 PepSY domain-containing protein [Sphingobacterium daejeonense]
MNIRNYNIYFNTHTISGIIICAFLYVIFFAGSFSFFRNDIAAWQQGESFSTFNKEEINYDYLLDSLGKTINLKGRDITFSLYHDGARSYMSYSDSKDSLENKSNLAKINAGIEDRNNWLNSDAKYFGYNFVNKKTGNYSENYDLAEFLYRLHFLAQLNEVPINIGIGPFGYVVAGLTSFLFLFALITGILLHWEKIVSNFFIFRPFNKWKTVWTDMHTALGVIGFPFQLVYAITGVFLILNSVLAIPFEKILYKGDSEKMYTELAYNHSKKLEYSYSELEFIPKVEKYVNEVSKKWPESKLTRITVHNYGDANMQIVLESRPLYAQYFPGYGIYNVRVKDNQVIEEKSPMQDATFVDHVKSLLYRLHFGDYAGYPLKFLSFIMGVMGCLVISSGIMIWLVARDKNNVKPVKRKFNFWLANVYLAICLSMFPTTAITFIAVKMEKQVDQVYIYKVYFWTWLILSTYYILRKNLNRTNRETLFLGSIIGICVPIANGVYSGDWIWKSFSEGKIDLFVVDLLWVVIGLIGLIICYQSNRYFNNLRTKIKKV